MSEEQFKAFWEAVQADTSLQEKLRAKTDPDSIASIAKEVASIAKEAGFEITAEEVEEAVSELSEDQLKGVAGGRSSYEGFRRNSRRPASQRAETQKGVAVVLGQLIELVWETGKEGYRARYKDGNPLT